jgi:hypothetical protein
MKKHAALVLLALGACRQDVARDADPAPAAPAAAAPSPEEVHQGLLYGRIITSDGAVYQGRLRWGGDQEALWGNYFNGVKKGNPWIGQVPAEQQPRERRSFGVLGIEIPVWSRRADVSRPFMARFGDITRIEPRGRDLSITLKSGTVVHLDRYAADDLADGVRVWDEVGGVVDLNERQIRTIDLLAPPQLGAAPGPSPLYGTVRTRTGDFTGFLQWDREQCLGSDHLVSHTADGAVSLRFDTIRSIAGRTGDGALVTLLDGQEIVLVSSREAGQRSRGIYVDDQLYGRVLVSWDAVERVDFAPGGTGPAYGDFPPGRPLTGSVLTRSGRRLAGRLVYDLDESETTETLDAPSRGIDYTILFSLISSIALPGPDGPQEARVTLRSGEELDLELTGDLGGRNAGMLIFVDSGQGPEYVPWNDVQQVDFELPPAGG